MAIYAVGDIQGCFDAFRRLLKKIRFDPDTDEVWLAGDLVNRGPKSLDVLWWAREHEHCVTAVLGNHDVYLLKRADGAAKKKRLDTLGEVLHAPELLDWLRHRPLVHKKGRRGLVHAGVHPSWSWKEVESRAGEVQARLQRRDFASLEKGRKRETLDILTRIRMVDAKGKPTYGYTGTPEEAPKGQRPWFEAQRATSNLTIYFGHWAALGHRIGSNWVALDSGCVWGHALTAVRLEDHTVYQVACR